MSYVKVQVMCKLFDETLCTKLGDDANMSLCVIPCVHDNNVAFCLNNTIMNGLCF